jgi:glyoxylase-like metal-dependent hydrolase (beta-lactamase superfamily II)
MVTTVRKRWRWRWIALALLVLGAVAYLYLQLWAMSVVRPSTGAERLSTHVYVVKEGHRGAMSNVGFIVGDQAALIIDSGLGSHNGQILAAELQKIAARRTLYISATHFHPEHMLGETAFPSSATVLRSTAQQNDIDARGLRMKNLFRIPFALPMMGAEYRTADKLFAGDLQLDLGGVRVQIMPLGPAHTAGDLGFYVEEDGVLFTGDVAMSGPLAINSTDSFFASASSTSSWLNSLQRLAAFNPMIVVPSHGPLGDASMIEQHRTLLLALHDRVVALKGEGKSIDQTVSTTGAEFNARYPSSTTVERAARLFYAELH